MKEQLAGEFDPKRFHSLLDVLSHAREKYGERPAYTCFDRTLNYIEVDRLSDNFARYLKSVDGLNVGDRIAIQLPNLLQFPIAMFGALKAGLVVVNTNPLYTSREMRHQFVDSGVKAIVILANFCDKLEKIIGETEIKHVVVTQVGDLQQPLRRMIMNLGARYLKKMVPAYNLPGAVSFTNALGEGSGQADSELPGAGGGDEVALVLYTGGTTGYAKGVMLSHNNLLTNMMQFWVRSRELINFCEESIAAPLPLYHSYAFLLHCVAMPFGGNHNFLIPNPRDLDTVIDVFKHHRITGVVGINTLYLALLQRDDIREVDFSSVKFCGAGGMPLTRKVAEEWEELVGCPVYEGYGLTECSPVVAVNSPSGNKPGTVGRPLVETEVKVVDDDGNTLAHGEKGELWIRGPQVMTGYWQLEKETREVLTEEGWFKSGDYVEVDEEGYIKIVDRKKDMILVSGFNVIPGEIEDYVNSHPQVLESAAIGVPDEHSGEVVVLYAVLKKGADLTAERLQDYCREGLTAYKRPESIHFVDELPKSNIGKVLRRELREQHLGSSGG